MPKMKQADPSSAPNNTAASPTDEAATLADISNISGNNAVAAAAGRPSPSATAVTSADPSTAIEAKSISGKAAEENTASSSSNPDARDGASMSGSSSYPTGSIATTPLSSTAMSLQKSICKTPARQGSAAKKNDFPSVGFTPIRATISAGHDNIRGGGSVVATPCPITSRSYDETLCSSETVLGREIVAASATASAMMDGYGYGYDGFEYPDFPPPPPLEETNFLHYPRQDDYALPPFLQAHLDETYAASSSSTLILPPIVPSNAEDSNGRQQQGEALFRFSPYRPVNNSGSNYASTSFNVTALGTAPPNPVGRRVAVNNGNVHTSSSSMAPLARAKMMAASAPPPTQPPSSTSSSKKSRPARSLPLRKRPLMEEGNGTEMEPGTNNMIDEDKVVTKRSSSNRPKGPSTKKTSLVKKTNMVRHNYNENRSTCKCAKSKCLKLYCDCFQSGRMCDPDKCECNSCMNTEKHNGPNGQRSKAISECLAKNPSAFQKRQRKPEEQGCGCKKNKCLKKYCVCFNVGAKCDELCRCKGCENREIDDEEEAFVDNVGFENVEEVNSMIEQPFKYVEVAPVEAGLVTTSSISDSSGSCSHQTSNDALYPPQQVQSSDYYGGESHACTPDNDTMHNTAGLWAEV